MNSCHGQDSLAAQRNYSASNCAPALLSPLTFTNPHMSCFLWSVSSLLLAFESFFCFFFKLTQVGRPTRPSSSPACANGHTCAQHVCLGRSGGARSWRARFIPPVLQMTSVPLAKSWHCSSLTHVAKGYTQMGLSYWHTPTHTHTHVLTSLYFYLREDIIHSLPTADPKRPNSPNNSNPGVGSNLYLQTVSVKVRACEGVPRL